MIPQRCHKGVARCHRFCDTFAVNNNRKEYFTGKTYSLLESVTVYHHEIPKTVFFVTPWIFPLNVGIVHV
jgi:hypothetical protein